jgi:CspA family cold shock protein
VLKQFKAKTYIYNYKQMSTSSTSFSNPTERFTGRVKWFNNKAGYGFITVTDGPKSGSDIFVHHSSIKVDSNQYKYLVQGEYVEFSLSSVITGSHEFQTGEVSGIKGGKLMCETRHELKTLRTQFRSTQETPDQQKTPRSVRPPQQSSAPRHNTLVERNASTDAHWTPAKKPRPVSILKRTTSTNNGRL